MATWLKQSTAVDLALGPFLDETDGKTAESALTLTQPDIRLKKNGGNWAQKNASQTLSHEENGWYEVSLDTTDTNTLGILIVAVHESGALPVWREFLVVAANIYDGLVGGGDVLQVDVAQWNNANIATPDTTGCPKVTLKSGTGTGEVALASGVAQADVRRWNNTAVPAEDTAGHPKVTLKSGSGAGEVALASGVAQSDVRRWNNTAVPAENTAGYPIVTVKDGTGTGEIDTASGRVQLTEAQIDQIVDEGWDEAISGHQGAGSAGEALDAAASASIAGPGALERTVGITVGGNPLEGASVWLATDAAGANVIAGPLTTSSQGEVSILVDAGIDLTTTAVTPMTTTLGTLRSRLRQELHDEDEANYRWTDAVLNRHLARAVGELSVVLPREQKTALNTTAGSRELAVDSLGDLVRIEAVEYPTGQWPASFVPFSLFESTLALLVDSAPAGVEAVNVYWGRLHTLDGSSSTLPATVEDVVITGAAAYAALEWASFATNRANVTGTAAFENYKAWGEERLRQFREALRGFGREARLRNAALYKAERGAGRNTVQWPS